MRSDVAVGWFIVMLMVSAVVFGYKLAEHPTEQPPTPSPTVEHGSADGGPDQ